jgi:ankyrin repeat protein
MDRFWAAPREGKLHELQHLLAPGNINDVLGDMRMTALHWAAQNGWVACVEWCLTVGANVNVQSRGNAGSPLQYASKRGHIDVVRILLDAGALVDTADYVGQTPLYYAICGNHLYAACLNG